jgi:hypothetical protein
MSYKHLLISLPFEFNSSPPYSNAMSYQCAVDMIKNVIYDGTARIGVCRI